MNPLDLTKYFLQNGDVLFHRFGNFSQGTKRQILSEFLPKRPQTVAKLKAKVFCGTYSRKGDFFMSACQDSKIRLYHTTDNSFRFKRSITARDVGWSVLDVALSPDGYNIIYSSWTNNSKWKIKRECCLCLARVSCLFTMFLQSTK